MCMKLSCLLGVLLWTMAAWGQTITPAPVAKPVRLPAKELIQQLQQANKDLPKFADKSEITPQHQEQAIAACELYKQAYARLAEFPDAEAKVALGAIGVQMGFLAGDPQTMLSGAKLVWKVLPAEQKVKMPPAMMLTWAGLFAGDPASAKEGLLAVGISGAGKGWDKWAQTLLPVAERCDKPISVGIRLVNGEMMNLQQSRGSAVVLDFWASWCKPCMMELPKIKAFYEARKDDANFKMVSLSLDDKPANAAKVITSAGMTWLQSMDGRKLRESFGGDGIPHVVVVSPEGRICWEGHPGYDDDFHMAVDFARRQAARIAKDAKALAALQGKPAPATQGATSAPAGAMAAAAPASKPVSESELAEQRYRLANSYAQAGAHAKAREILKDLLKQYPKTTTAEKARKDLADMGG